MEVALAGEQADPRVPAPTALRPVLGFARLSAASYGLIERVVDADPAFRERVAEAASEASVGRAGWLWLARPAGWEDDPALRPDALDGGPGGEATARLRRERAGAEAAAARHRREAEAAESARRQAEQDLAAARAEAARVAAAEEERVRLEARVAELEAERTQLLRRLKDVEADVGALRRDLKVAREATREAEAELLAAGQASAAPGADRDGARRRAAHLAVAAAAEAAAEAVRALEAATTALEEPTAPTGAPGGAPARARRATRRRPPPVPAGLHGDSPEVHRHLVRAAGALLVVDGYNLARTAWPGLEPEEERRRTVALLEEHRARTGVAITVVFDGDSATVAPVASRTVEVRFSATGTTADDDIAALLSALPATQAVVVVSSDREVADDARRQGAAVLGAADFLAAAGR